MDEIKNFLKQIKMQKVNGIIRKLDELGRVVIPVVYRNGKVKDGETKILIHNIEEYVIIEILKDQLSKTNKKFDELGRVVVNVEIRNKLAWRVKDNIEIWNCENYFILRKKEIECIFCGNKKNLNKYKEKFICNRCKKEIINV